MSATFELDADRAGADRRQAVHENGTVIADSEGDASRRTPRQGIESVPSDAPEATVERVD